MEEIDGILSNVYSLMKKVVVLGPESTGKTTLTRSLSDHYLTNYVKEYARDYLESKNNHYVKQDLLHIAKGQIKLEKKAEQECRDKNNSIIFYDTDLSVIKIWSDFKYGTCDPWILKELNHRKYDLYLLTYPDLQWHPDPLREHPNDADRMKIFDLYKKDLISRNVDFRVIKGNRDQRIRKVIEIVDNLLK